MRSFEERFRTMTKTGASPSDAGFSADLVQAYVLAGAEHGGMRLAAAAVLRAFPREWWAPAIEEVLYGERRPGSWRGDYDFVRALVEVDPQRFVDAPRELIVRIGHGEAVRFFLDHRDAVLTRLCAAVADDGEPFRWKCAACLLSLDRSAEAFVEEELRRADADARVRASWELTYAGYEASDDGSLRRLFADGCYRLSLAPGYLPGPDAAPGSAEGVAHAFGGRVEAPEKRRDPLCEYHVLTLDPVPDDLGVTLARLTLAVDLDDLLYEGTPHFFRHREDGGVEPLDPRSGTPMAPLSADSPAIVPAWATLVRETDHEQHDTWGSARRRYYRLGGRAVFVQDHVYPSCPLCSRLMPHLLSLDSGLPLERENEHGVASLEWGSGGVACCFWCDTCRVSEWEWACT